MPLSGMGRDPAIKPEWGAQIDGAHPLAQGLVNWFALNETGGTPRDVVGGVGGSVTAGIGWTASETGPCLVKSASTATTTDYVDTGLQISSSSGTIVFRIYPAAVYNSGTNEQLWGAAQISPTVIDFGCLKYTDNNLYCGWYNNGVDGRVIVSMSAVNWVQNQWQTYALVWFVGGSVLYRNGVQIGSTAIAPPVASIGANLYLFNQGRSTGAASSLTQGTRFSDWMVYNRALSAGEVASLYAEPYGLFLPDSVRRFYTSALALQRLLAETWALSDARSAALNKLIGEALGLADARQIGCSKRVAEIWNLTDSRMLGIARLIGEILGWTDAVQATGAGMAVLTLVTSGAMGDGIETAGLGDALRALGGKA